MSKRKSISLAASLKKAPRLKGLFAAASAAALVAGLPSSEAGVARKGSGDEFLVVNCLLPGQVKQLGSRMTYMGRRRPALVTARECEKRGGEYILEDRASVAGSIEAWMPLAMQGDAKAQTYLGELLERVDQGQPDYAMAMLWYQRAAAQGYSQAQFNLARLYEFGLGVDKSAEKANEWYLKAYGFEGELAGDVSLIPIAELEGLKSTIATQDRTIAAQTTEIAQLNTRISELQSESARLQQQSAAAKQRVAALERTLATDRAAFAVELDKRASAPSGSSPAALGQLEEARADLANREAALKLGETRLAASQRELETRLASVASANSAAAALKTEIESLRSRLAQERETAAALSAERDMATEARESALSELGDLRKEMTANMERLADQERLLAQRETALAEKRSSQSQSPAPSETGLQDERAAIASARAQLEIERASLATQARDYRKKLEDLDARSAELELATMKLRKQRADLAVRTNDIINREEDLTRRFDKLALQETGLEAVKAERIALENARSAMDAAQAAFDTQVTRFRQKETDFAQELSQLEKRASEVAKREMEVEQQSAAAARAQESAREAMAQISILQEQIRTTQASFTTSQRSLTPAAELTPKPLSKAFRVNFGRYHALLIGNENYENPDWPDLDTAHNDVDSIGALLKEKYGFSTTVLKDANRYQILKTISELGANLGSGDNLLIYYAGHGQYIDKIGSGYWEPVDSVPYQTINSISVQDINAQLSLTDARKVLVVSDSCYSGAFTRAPFPMLDAAAAHDTREKYLQQVAAKRSRNVMTAGGLQPVADGLGNGHSLFARAFISALVNTDDVALGRDVFTRVRDLVTVNATAMNWEQEPEYDEILHSGHEGGDFIFVPLKS